MAEHTGGMIALLPSADDAQRYALTGDKAEPPDQMHVTLQYLGDDVTGWDDERRARARTVAEKAVSDLGAPLSARVFAHATFNPDAHDDRDPCAVYLIGDSDKIGPLHQQVSTACRALLGDDHPAQHLPFHPHMTAGYGLTAADLTEVGPVLFDRIGLFLGEGRTELPLSSAAVGASETVRAWLSGYATTRQPLTGHARLRCRAVEHATRPGHGMWLVTEDGHTTGLVTAVTAQRNQTHDDARDALAVVLIGFTAGVSIPVIRAAVQPDASRPTRRDQAAGALLGQLAGSPVQPQWQAAVRDAHTTATVAGTAAAAHLLSRGATPVQPEPGGLPNPANPDPWIEQQIGAMGGDVAAALAGDTAVSDAELAAILELGAGAQYELDMQIGQAYLDGMLALYAAMGQSLLAWRAVWDERVCQPCMTKDRESPYTADTVPGVDHGGCRCTIIGWP